MFKDEVRVSKMTTEIDRKKAASRLAAMEATNLASKEGLYRCRYCKQLKPLQEGLVAMWGGNVMFAACPGCLPRYPVVIKQELHDGVESFYIGPLNREDAPSDIVVVKSMDALREYAPKKTLAAFERKDFSDDIE